jgi:hypothetical protein
MIKRSVWHGILYLALAGVSLQAGTIVLGDPPLTGTGNCDPFGCPEFFGLGTYQQVYAAAAFPGTIAIDGLTFFEGQVAGNGGQPAGGTYTLSFSYTSEGPGNLSLASASTNMSSDSQIFFAGSLPALAPGTSGNLLSFSGTPFVYNPSDGDLLLTVSVSDPADANNYLYLDQAQCGPKTGCPLTSPVVSGSVYFGTSDGIPISGGNNTGGLVTDFGYTSAGGASTPEPGTWLLAAAGIAAIAYQRRHRRIS